MLDEGTRAAMHCGYLDESAWPVWRDGSANPPPPPIGPPGAELDLGELGVCPGWLIRQQPVIDATRAAQAHKHRALALFFPGEENAVLEAAAEGVTAWQAYEAAAIREASKKGGR